MAFSLKEGSNVMDRRIRLLGVAAALLFSPASFVPAFAQNVGDPCTGTDRQYTVSGPGSSALVCNGSTLELLGKDLSNPVRKGIGTATPAATLDVAGEAKIGNTNLACSATTEGAMRYNSTSKEMEYCNGTAWASLSPAAGGGLKVYKADGTTVLGNLVGSYAADCPGLVYADSSTGTVNSLDTTSCLSTASPISTIYFSTNACSGLQYAAAGTIGYCCTGTSSCTTTLCRADPENPPASHTYASRRSNTGVCTVTSGSITSSSVVTSLLCGNGDCLVK